MLLFVTCAMYPSVENMTRPEKTDVAQLMNDVTRASLNEQVL